MANKNSYDVWFADGNTKIGDILTWNKLAGGGEIMGCEGSCKGHCDGCYNPDDPYKSGCYCFKSYRQYGETVILAHIRNTKAMRENMNHVFEQLGLQLSRKHKITPIRIHSAGEIESAEELLGWVNFARKFPAFTMYVYTKNYEALDKVMGKLKKNKKALPNNFFINISIWHEHGLASYFKWKRCKNIRAFAYVDYEYDYEANGLRLDGLCPAYKVMKSGKVKLVHDLTCDKCKICFSNRKKVLGCLSH